MLDYLETLGWTRVAALTVIVAVTLYCGVAYVRAVVVQVGQVETAFTHAMGGTR